VPLIEIRGIIGVESQGASGRIMGGSKRTVVGSNRG